MQREGFVIVWQLPHLIGLIDAAVLVAALAGIVAFYRQRRGVRRQADASGDSRCERQRMISY